MQILTKSGDRHWSSFGSGYGYPGKIRRKRRQEYALFTKESVEVPGMGPGESYTGVFGRSVQQDGYWSKDLEYRPGAIFKVICR